MSLVENSFCQLCQVAFDSAGDLSLHSCADIKEEIQDYELPTNVKLNVDFEKSKAMSFKSFSEELSKVPFKPLSSIKQNSPPPSPAWTVFIH